MKVKTTRGWSPESVRRCCCNYNLYTRGTAVAYQSMLAKVRRYRPTDNNLLRVAIDIVAHSEEQTVEYVMYLLFRDAVNTFFEVQEV